jgi:hypothetical protein
VDDLAAIDALVARFFGLFSPQTDGVTRLDDLYDQCIPRATIIKHADGVATVYSVDEFIAPRAALLNSGSLRNFYEHEIHARTEIFGDIAQRLCSYEKRGEASGAPFSGRGVKTTQFVRVDSVWKISSIVWQDETETLPIPAFLLP